MNRLEEMTAFVAVVDYQGFGNAGDRLGIAKSMISRRVSELERRLGVQLLQRTTRRQTLTDAGRTFYERASRLLADLDEAEQSVVAAEGEITGRIRVTLPLAFGVSVLADPIAEFLRLHPQISLDVDLNERTVDLIEENVDLAIRVGKLGDSSLVARRLASVRFVTCASPAYLQRHGEPRHPRELLQREVLVYSNVPAGRQWSYEEGGKRISPRVRYRVSANNGEFLATLASRDLAVVNGPRAYLWKFVERGELVPILTEYPSPSIGMYAVYPPGRLVSRRVRALSDALYAHFQDREI
ncbi:MAG: LysR family transcriptional regulator [Gammaproteobacteria bacterium]|nr:LysR family transcriptional regulator [Gammaproteobacteria bacterium]